MRGCITLIIFIAGWMVAVTTLGMWVLALLALAIVWAVVFTVGYTFEKTGKSLQHDSTVHERLDEVESEDHIGS